MARQSGPKAPAYITPEGYQDLHKEFDALWQRRVSVTQALAAAAAEGDRSENAEYIYRKKELREIDRRIRYLQKRLPDLIVVHDPPPDRQRIFFGAWVRLEDNEGRQAEYRIVGPDEFNIKRGRISVASPLARALLKKCVDEKVTVVTPKGTTTYYVVAVSYEAPAGRDSGD